MQSMEIRGLDALDADLKELLEEFPEMRRELHNDFGVAAKLEVNRAIASSGLNDSNGHIRKWQIKKVGSKGGYAAVRSIGDKEGGGTGRDGAGAITRYLESGHNVRSRTEKSRSSRRQRLKKASVRGFLFYKAASETFESKAIKIAEEFRDSLVDRLEGRR